MVDDSRFRRKMAALRQDLPDKMAKAIERQATSVTKEMRLFLASFWPEVAAKATIDWTWGDAPEGAVTIGELGRADTEALAVTIFARANQGSGFDLRWFEFGTAPRRQKKTGRYTGRIVARPFFLSTWRANRRRVKTNIRAALRRELKRIQNI